MTGPTGSGKSTTLYATLNQLNKPDRNIITVEDPVEYRLPGHQPGADPPEGRAHVRRRALRSILRADPDIVLVGEIRDKETAIIAIEAALTGHLVLSTLHTNDAASTPMRLVEMGVEPFLVDERARLRRRPTPRAQALRQVQGAVPADRGRARRRGLAGRGARSGRVADAAPRRRLRRRAGAPATAAASASTRSCSMSEEIERLIIERRSSEDIQKVALMQGMLSMRADGLRKAGMGLTSLEEIFRVVA